MSLTGVECKFVQKQTKHMPKKNLMIAIFSIAVSRQIVVRTSLANFNTSIVISNFCLLF